MPAKAGNNDDSQRRPGDPKSLRTVHGTHIVLYNQAINGIEDWVIVDNCAVPVSYRRGSNERVRSARIGFRTRDDMRLLYERLGNYLGHPSHVKLTKQTRGQYLPRNYGKPQAADLPPGTYAVYNWDTKAGTAIIIPDIDNTRMYRVFITDTKEVQP